MNGREFGEIEWPQGGGGVLDRLTFDQIRAMGVGIKTASYGVRLWYRKTVVIVTAWPLPQEAAPDAAPSQPSEPSTGQPVRAVAASAGSGDPWQPDWRTRAYVQPERTTANGGPHISVGG